jgi:hypothetical protein
VLAVLTLKMMVARPDQADMVDMVAGLAIGASRILGSTTITVLVLRLIRTGKARPGGRGQAI